MNGDAQKPKYRKKFINEDSRRRKWLVLTDYQLVLNVIKHFSGFIKKLEITDGVVIPIDRDRLRVVNRYINRYSSDYLIDFKMVIKNNTLQEFTVPFTSVNQFECNLHLNEIGVDILPLNQLFPQLKRATFEMSSTQAYAMIDCTFPHLEAVKISLLHGSEEREQQGLIRNFLAKNTHIKSLEILHFSWEHVKLFSIYLRNLHNLTIISNEYDVVDTIHFDSVKHFHLPHKNDKFIMKLLFPRLESLRFTIDGRISNWEISLNNHRTVKKLHLSAGYEWRRDYVVRLTEKLRNLMEIEINGSRFLNIDDFEQITMRNCPKMTKVIQNLWHGYNGIEDDYMKLIERFGNIWNITERSNTEISVVFLRKNAMYQEQI